MRIFRMEKLNLKTYDNIDIKQNHKMYSRPFPEKAFLICVMERRTHAPFYFLSSQERFLLTAVMQIGFSMHQSSGNEMNSAARLDRPAKTLTPVAARCLRAAGRTHRN